MCENHLKFPRGYTLSSSHINQPTILKIPHSTQKESVEKQMQGYSSTWPLKINITLTSFHAAWAQTFPPTTIVTICCDYVAPPPTFYICFSNHYVAQNTWLASAFRDTTESTFFKRMYGEASYSIRLWFAINTITIPARLGSQLDPNLAQKASLALGSYRHCNAIPFSQLLITYNN